MEHHNIKQRAQKLDLRNGDLAALANLSAPKLSNFLRGRVTLDAVKRKELIQILDDIEKLRSYFPIPFGSSDPKLLAVALERFRTGRFESFSKLTKAIDWAQPQSMSRKFPKLFKEDKEET